MSIENAGVVQIHHQDYSVGSVLNTTYNNMPFNYWEKTCIPDHLLYIRHM